MRRSDEAQHEIMFARRRGGYAPLRLTSLNSIFVNADVSASILIILVSHNAYHIHNSFQLMLALEYRQCLCLALVIHP